MIFFILIVIFSMLLLSKYLTNIKVVYHIILLYILWYGLNLILSYWNPFGLNDVGVKTYFFQILGYSSLIIGFLVHPSINESAINNSSIINIDFQKSNFFRFNVLISLVVIIVVLKKFLIISALLPKEARDLYFEEMANEVSIPLFTYIWSWYIPVVVFFVQTLLALILISKNEISKFWTAIYILVVVSYLSIGFGRAQIQQFLYTCLLFFIINKNGHINILKQKTELVFENKRSLFILVLVFSISIFAIGLITNLRGITDNSNQDKFIHLKTIVEQFVIYNTGGFAAFDYALNHNYEYNFGPLYGSGAFASIENLFYFINNNIDYSNNILGRFLQAKTIDVGAYFQWNFAYTMFYVFYKDLGVFGLVIFPFLLGFFFKRIILLFLINKNFYYLIILTFLSYSLFYSNFAYLLQSLTSLFIISTPLFFSYLSKLKLSNQ